MLPRHWCQLPCPSCLSLWAILRSAIAVTTEGADVAWIRARAGTGVSRATWSLVLYRTAWLGLNCLHAWKSGPPAPVMIVLPRALCLLLPLLTYVLADSLLLPLPRSMLLMPVDFSADRVGLVCTCAPDTFWAFFARSRCSPWELLSGLLLMHVDLGLHSALPTMALQGNPLSGPAYFDSDTWSFPLHIMPFSRAHLGIFCTFIICIKKYGVSFLWIIAWWDYCCSDQFCAL